MKNAIVVILVLAAVALGVVIARNRPTPDQDAVEYRQALMTVIGGQMQPLSLMQEGRMPYSAALARQHAADMAVLASMIPEAFARNTSAARNLNTAALAYVWSDHADFLRSAHRLQSDADELKSAVNTGDQTRTGSAIGTLGAECAQCHRSFRGN